MAECSKGIMTKTAKTENEDEIHTSTKGVIYQSRLFADIMKKTVETENADEVQIKTKGAIYHCRTKYNTKAITFVWSIDNFWDISNFLDTLTSSYIKGQNFKLQLRINKEKNKLSFFILPLDRKVEINIHKYNVSIQNTLNPLMLTNWKIFGSITEPLCDIYFETLRLHETTYLFKNTLSICFMFELFDNILHNITYKNILETQSQTLTTNDVTRDDRFCSRILFVINQKLLDVKISLLERANSKIFNNMIEKYDKRVEEQGEDDEEEIYIRIDNVKYEIFQLLLLFLESSAYLDIKLNKDDTYGYVQRLSDLLEAANKFDIKDLKVWCEEQLIKYIKNILKYIKYIKKDNVVKLLNIAIKNNAANLKSYTERLIKLYMEDTTSTTEFMKLTEDNPKILYEIFKQELVEENASYSKTKNTE